MSGPHHLRHVHEKRDVVTVFVTPTDIGTKNIIGWATVTVAPDQEVTTVPAQVEDTTTSEQATPTHKPTASKSESAKTTAKPHSTANSSSPSSHSKATSASLATDSSSIKVSATANSSPVRSGGFGSASHSAAFDVASATSATPSTISPSATAAANSSSGLGSGALGGIVGGGLALVAIFLGIILLLIRKKKQAAKAYGKPEDEKDILGSAAVFDEKRAVSPPLSPAPEKAPRVSLRPVTQFLPNGILANSTAPAAAAHANASTVGTALTVDTATTVASAAAAASAAGSNQQQIPAMSRSQSINRKEPPTALPLGNPANVIPRKPLMTAPANKHQPSPAFSAFSEISDTPGSAPIGGAVGGPAAGPAAGPVYRVHMPFGPSMEDELELKSGQLVRILHEYDDGWALCIRLDRSQQGVCPRTCLSARPVKPRSPPPGGPPQGGPANRGAPGSPVTRGPPRPGFPANNGGHPQSPQGPQGRPLINTGGLPQSPGYRTYTGDSPVLPSPSARNFPQPSSPVASPQPQSPGYSKPVYRPSTPQSRPHSPVSPPDSPQASQTPTITISPSQDQEPSRPSTPTQVQSPSQSESPKPQSPPHRPAVAPIRPSPLSNQTRLSNTPSEAESDPFVFHAM